MRKNGYRMLMDSAKVLLYEAKVRNNLSDEALAKRIGLSSRTIQERRRKPENLTLDKLAILSELAGKEIKFVEKEEQVI